MNTLNILGECEQSFRINFFSPVAGRRKNILMRHSTDAGESKRARGRAKNAHEHTRKKLFASFPIFINFRSYLSPVSIFFRLGRNLSSAFMPNNNKFRTRTIFQWFTGLFLRYP